MIHRSHINLHPELTHGRPFRHDGLLHAVIALLLRLWPRRSWTTAELSTIECLKLDQINKTIQQLRDMHAVARGVVIIAEAGNLPLPYTFTSQNSHKESGKVPAEHFTLHAIDVEGRLAWVSVPGESAKGKWIHTDDLARAIDACHYQPGDITFGLIEQIPGPKK